MPGPRRRWPPRRASSVAGGVPLVLPLVSMVAFQPATAAGEGVLVGSVNPQGEPGTAWFEWGITPQLGQATAPQTLTPNALPQTITATVSGLADGQTYWAAMVGRTAAGTVMSAALSLTPSTVGTQALAPSPVTSAPSVTIPHLDYPMVITPAGALVVEQDSDAEILACVRAIAACQKGTIPEIPTFGITDPTFGQLPLDPGPIVTEIQTWEPRAIVEIAMQVNTSLAAGG